LHRLKNRDTVVIVASKINDIQSGQDAIDIVRARTDTILLAFSCGKDSIAAWLECRKHFNRVIPLYMYLVPDLEFVADNLRYYERFFDCQIHQIPHPSLYRQLRNNVFQPPTSWPVIQAARLPGFDYADAEGWLREDQGLSPDAYTATGVRSADSITRRLAIRHHGAVNHAKRKFYPVHDWTKQRMLDEFAAAGVQLPSDYLMFGRSLDGLTYEYLEPIKRNHPRDFARILEVFPLAELELKRREYATNHRA
jgi:hypothetical protein